MIAILELLFRTFRPRQLLAAGRILDATAGALVVAGAMSTGAFAQTVTRTGGAPPLQATPTSPQPEDRMAVPNMDTKEVEARFKAADAFWRERDGDARRELKENLDRCNIGLVRAIDAAHEAAREAIAQKIDYFKLIMDWYSKQARLTGAVDVELKPQIDTLRRTLDTLKAEELDLRRRIGVLPNDERTTDVRANLMQLRQFKLHQIAYVERSIAELSQALGRNDEERKAAAAIVVPALALLVGLQAGPARAQSRPAIEVVPPDPIAQAERAQTQAHAAWLKVSRDLERELLSGDPGKLLTEIAEARGKKQEDLNRRGAQFEAMIAGLDCLIETAAREAPVVAAFDEASARDAIAERMEQLVRELARAQGTGPAAQHEVRGRQLDMLRALLATMDTEERLRAEFDRDASTWRAARDATVSAVKSARDGIQRMRENLALEQAQWDVVYDAEQETVERRLTPPTPGSGTALAPVPAR